MYPTIELEWLTQATTIFGTIVPELHILSTTKKLGFAKLLIFFGHKRVSKKIDKRGLKGWTGCGRR